MASSHGERSSTIGVDSICDEFEAAWLAGREPRIEAFLARGEALDQNLLLRELLLAEWDLCRRHDRPIELAPYLERFAASQPAINDLWSAFWRERQPDSGRDQGATIGFIPPKEIAFSEAPGTVIDRFKLLEKLGEGGFGTVWAAEQREPVKRRVALKIIKLGMDTRQVVARFEAERQALALMDHANIAKVFDAGATETGRPYFVMELVRGIPITEYCDQERLTAQARLDLVVKVCHAIQHAHQKGIIHRDIKPSNILVTLHDGVPVPKVIDFGIAKAVQQDLTEKTIYTQLAQFIGTPAYMSPEQAEMSGLDIDTRSDIYSLGVLLYELLTGVTPFDAKELLRSGLDEMRKIIREQEPLTPSTRLTKAVENAKKSGVTNSAPPGTSRMPHLAIDRDLDLIVMKCLEKDRTRRYETANSLAGDIGRYLRDEPVEACPPSTVYRFRKFIRRQKTGLMIATVLTAALLVVLGVVAGSIGWAVRDRATRQAAIDIEVDVALKEATRLQAQRKYADALAALPTKSRLSGSSQELQQRAGALRKELQMVLRLESLPLEGARTTSDGGFNFALEDSEYEKAFRQFGIDASALSPQEIADRVSATMIRLELASELDNWVFTRSFVRPQGDELAKKLMAATRLADPDKLRNRIRDAQETHDAQALNDLLSAENDELLQWPTWRLFYAALYQMKQWEQLMTLSHRLRRQRPEDFWNNFMLGSLYANWEPPQWEESARFYTAALSLNPENAAARNDLAWLLVNWPDPGVDHFEEAVDLAKKAVQSTPTAGKYRVTLGVAHYRAGQWSDALSAFQEATKLQKGGDSLVWFYLAMVHWQLGDKEQARKWYDQALQRLELYDPETRELKSTRAEAAKLLGIKEREPSNNWFKQLLKHSVTQ